MKKISIGFLLTIFLYSCTSGVDTQALRDEILDIHDEVMPKMGEIMSLRKKVMTKSEELSLTENFDQAEVNSLDSLASALETANKDMMTWMNDWHKNSSAYLDQDGMPLEGREVEDVVNYLEDEKQRVSKVKENINAAIKTAKEALNN